jgi:hypothetical protein
LAVAVAVNPSPLGEGGPSGPGEGFWLKPSRRGGCCCSPQHSWGTLLLLLPFLKGCGRFSVAVVVVPLSLEQGEGGPKARVRVLAAWETSFWPTPSPPAKAGTSPSRERSETAATQNRPHPVAGCGRF